MAEQVSAATQAWPRIGLGTWRFGERSNRAEQEVGAVRHALQLGYRLIDTAEMYGEGGAEKIVGKALAEAFANGTLRREELIVVSKVYPHNASRSGCVRACRQSLKRLGLQSIDCYLLHWRGSYPLTETVGAFMTLKEEGLIDSFGVSNFDVDDMAELEQVCNDLGAGPCPVNQIYYALAERGPEFTLLPWQRARTIKTMAYSPLAEGALRDHRELVALASSMNASASQVALAWLMRCGDVVPIPKAASALHLEENLKAQELELSPEILARLDQIFVPPKAKRPLAMI